MIVTIVPVPLENQTAVLCAVDHAVPAAAGDLPPQISNEAVTNVSLVPKPGYSAEDQDIFRNTVAGFGMLSREHGYARQRAANARRLGRLSTPR